MRKFFASASYKSLSGVGYWHSTYEADDLIAAKRIALAAVRKKWPSYVDTIPLVFEVGK